MEENHGWTWIHTDLLSVFIGVDPWFGLLSELPMGHSGMRLRRGAALVSSPGLSVSGQRTCFGLEVGGGGADDAGGIVFLGVGEVQDVGDEVRVVFLVAA